MDRLRTAAGIVHDVSLDLLEDDPYPVYAWMRRHRPIAHVPETERVWITTWDLCDEAGRNDRVFGPTSEVFHAVYGDPNVMSLGGPEHLAHRAALNARFRPRAVSGYREPVLRATAARYIDAIRDRGQADANAAILERISMRAIGDVLGLTDVPDDTLIRWFRGFSAYLVDFGRSSEVAEYGRAIKAELAAYLRTRLGPLVAEPDGSTLSHLLHDGMPAGTTRGVDAIIGDIGVMIVGGFQESAHGAANSRPQARPGPGRHRARLGGPGGQTVAGRLGRLTSSGPYSRVTSVGVASAAVRAVCRRVLAPSA